jgi:predicted nucleic acid-binding protein
VTGFVVDANVGVKWLELFRKEPLVIEARAFLELSVQRKFGMMVPDLFWPEVGNILWKAVRRNQCTPQDATKGLSLLENLELQTVPCSSIAQAALEIALHYRRSVYDSLYVALAQASQSELITADEKLANALAGHLPVKWLGAI